jgi:hypothetical protein
MNTRKPAAVLFSLALSLVACGAPAAAPTPSATSTPPQAAIEIPASTPTATASPEPSPTPTPALLDLEIVEWFEHAIPNLADPTITDTNVEILVHNPNDLPVSVNTDEMEVRLLNAAGEVVYTNGSAYFSLWQGSWMLAGESTGFKICACFQSTGLETQEWESLELVAPLEPATDRAYTTDVEVTLGEPFSLAEAHLGGSGTGIPITMRNTSDQPLESIPMRVIARDASGRYIGMPAFGNSVVSFIEDISIQPGDSLQGVLDSDIDYFAGPLTYEVAAIGIPAQGAAATEEFALPSGTPLGEWEGIPIMPGAISGDPIDGGYQFTVQATLDEVVLFYDTELANLGYETTVDETVGYSTVSFNNGSTNGVIVIAPLGGITGVAITIGG